MERMLVRPSFLPSSLPSFLPSFLPSLLPSFLPSFVFHIFTCSSSIIYCVAYKITLAVKNYLCLSFLIFKWGFDSTFHGVAVRLKGLICAEWCLPPGEPCTNVQPY